LIVPLLSIGLLAMEGATSSVPASSAGSQPAPPWSSCRNLATVPVNQEPDNIWGTLNAANLNCAGAPEVRCDSSQYF
jgi:hypothetical protein